MASIGNQILIKMGLDSSQLEKGLNQSKQEIKATGQAIDAMGAKWKATSVEPQFPRLNITLGGVYNGEDGE